MPMPWLGVPLGGTVGSSSGNLMRATSWRFSKSTTANPLSPESYTKNRRAEPSGPAPPVGSSRPLAQRIRQAGVLLCGLKADADISAREVVTAYLAYGRKI